MRARRARQSVKSSNARSDDAPSSHFVVSGGVRGAFLISKPRNVITIPHNKRDKTMKNRRNSENEIERARYRFHDGGRQPPHARTRTAARVIENLRTAADDGGVGGSIHVCGDFRHDFQRV